MKRIKEGQQEVTMGKLYVAIKIGHRIHWIIACGPVQS